MQMAKVGNTAAAAGKQINFRQRQGAQIPPTPEAGVEELENWRAGSAMVSRKAVGPASTGRYVHQRASTHWRAFCFAASSAAS